VLRGYLGSLKPAETVISFYRLAKVTLRSATVTLGQKQLAVVNKGPLEGKPLIVRYTMYSSELYQHVIIRYKNQSELDRKTVVFRPYSWGAKRIKRNPRARLNVSPQPFSPFPRSFQTFRLGRYDVLQSNQSKQ